MDFFLQDECKWKVCVHRASLLQRKGRHRILAWSKTCQSVVYKTETCNSYNKYNNHTEPLFNQSSILKLKELYEYESSFFMYDFANNRLPHSFDNTFKYNREIQEIRITRQVDLLHLERGTSTFYQSLPLYSLPHILIKWRHILPSESTRAIFKTTGNRSPTCFICRQYKM